MTRLEKMKGQLGFLNDELKALLDKEERTPEDYQKMKQQI